MSVLFALTLTLLMVVAPKETPQPENSGRLADRTFVVTTHLGRGIARYFGSGSLDGDATARRVLIVVHGVLRDADYYYDTGREAIASAHAAHVLLIAPQFVEKVDLHGSVPADTLYWNGEWPGGSDAVAPAPISTYDVLDAILARLSDRERFPAMKEIVVAGHSAGGQIVQRYAVVGKAPQLAPGSAVPVHLVVANPSSYYYFSNWRPDPQKRCGEFNHWRYGLIGAPRYVIGTATALEARYVTRHVTYLLGTADTDPHEEDLDRSCGGEAQGPYRFARGKNYIHYLQQRHPGGTRQTYAFVRGVGHNNRRMFTSPCGRATLFGPRAATCVDKGDV
jgi:pimeloyl-ACP methyl ester carboxylesterase